MTPPRGRRWSGVHLIWCAAFAVALGGNTFAFRIVAAAIDERSTRVARSADQLRADERIIADRPRLLVEREQLRTRLARVAFGGDATHLVARFLHDAARISARHRTTITTIAASNPTGVVPPRVAGPEPVAATAASRGANGADPFQPIPLEVTIEGRYLDLLATLSELSATPVLAQIELSSLARKNVDAPDATLSAALHVVLERLAPRAAQFTGPSEAGDVRPRLH